MSTIEVFPFQYRDPRTRKWVRARYKASPDEIRERYAEWEITGPAEARTSGSGAMFNPFRKVVRHADLMRSSDPPLQMQPHQEKPPAIDAGERLLVCLFLRRYVTYCARRRRFAQMRGAADLLDELRALPA